MYNNLLFALFLQPIQSLSICSKENVTKVQICTLDENYNTEDSGKRPLQVKSSMTLLSLSDFDENLREMSMTILLAMVWNDTRLTLESNISLK